MRQFFKNKTDGFSEVRELPINRALLFGDGLFETMVFTNGHFRFHEDHQARAIMGLKKLRIESIPDLLKVKELLNITYGKNATLRVRWNIFRSGIGKYSPMENDHCEHLIVTDFQPSPGLKNKAYISNSIQVNASPWAGTKTLNALTYVLANIERKQQGMDDVILLDDKGNISEGGSSNIFWVKNNNYFTPSLQTNCIAGIARKQILDQLKNKGFNCEVGIFKAKDLMDADQVFVSNVTGISYLLNIDGKTFDTRPEPTLLSLFEI
ncbi:aminotransferase class IV [Cyclobacterium qasimii]|uniref:branched-chain-amino-acid transaminase n=2 Tax=Cyclobacterium qasimii TaxID=1350429 RepID=S7VE70_9BACT|nr:aminotransferase class IV [Cyclobacterium qasimii]EPR67832.1 Aminodeoxychorismate lyase [Cyclobacterium qasimii M12-11B]GEO20414.1 4-amino-4-deoxychorismate lyase [Cyclobacterium qasimii]